MCLWFMSLTARHREFPVDAETHPVCDLFQSRSAPATPAASSQPFDLASYSRLEANADEGLAADFSAGTALFRAQKKRAKR